VPAHRHICSRNLSPGSRSSYSRDFPACSQCRCPRAVSSRLQWRGRPGFTPGSCLFRGCSLFNCHKDITPNSGVCPYALIFPNPQVKNLNCKRKFLPCGWLTPAHRENMGFFF
jgi:hypothetical protein